MSKERGLSFNKKETLKVTEPSAWELISFVISKLSDEEQQRLAEEDDLLRLVLAVKSESGDDAHNVRKIEIMAKHLRALERLGKLVIPALTPVEIKKTWMLDSMKQDQAKQAMN